MKKDRILIVGGFPSIKNRMAGGIVTSCKILMESSFPNRFEIITLDSTQKSNPIPNIFFRLFYSIIKNIQFIYKLIFYRPALVILFPGAFASLLEKGFMGWIAYFLKIHVFLFPRGWVIVEYLEKSRFKTILIKLIFGSASKILCQGPAWKRFISKNLLLSNDRTPIIYNWTATQDLLSIGKNKINRIKEKEQLNVLFLGWIEKEKGIFDLIETCKDIRNDYNFKLFIAGGGKDEEDVRKYINDNNMEKITKFSGWVYNKDLRDLLEKSDILVLPSWYEGFPNVVVEAMSSGIAVITSNVGNIPDIITDGKEALLVTPRNKEELKNKILCLFDNYKLRVRLISEAYNFAEKNFNINNAVIKLESHINLTLNK